MGVRYNGLFKILIDKGLSKTEFAEKVNISPNTMAKFSKNEYVSLQILIKICNYLDCTLDDIVEVLPSKKSEEF